MAARVPVRQPAVRNYGINQRLEEQRSLATHE